MPDVKLDEVIVRADGYLLRLTPKTAFTSDLSDPSLHGLRTNVWITYHGASQADGTILVDKASIRDNIVAAHEDHLLKKTSYDPEKVEPSAKQSAISKNFHGIDPKKIPPYQDKAMQDRVDRIGNSLVPTYQRDLPDSDPTKIDFRFQVVDEKKWHGAISWPSGVILIPRQTVDRLPDDSQLAAVIADNIAVAIEKQTLLREPVKRQMTAMDVAGALGGIVVPGLSLVTGATNANIAQEFERQNEEQSGRVSLALLSDAGYDLHQAPLAWWRIWAKDPAKLVETPLPQRTINLYWGNRKHLAAASAGSLIGLKRTQDKV